MCEHSDSTLNAHRVSLVILMLINNMGNAYLTNYMNLTLNTLNTYLGCLPAMSVLGL